MSTRLTELTLRPNHAAGIFRRQQRDYIYRRRLFIDLIAEPKGWKFTEIITPDTKGEINEWKKLARGMKRE